MKDKREEARQFSEDLDKKLGGKEAGADRSDEIRRTLDFARKMESLRSEPSLQFQSRLKQQLLIKIAAQNMYSTPERGWFERIIRQPLWQTVTAVLVIAIVAGAAWGAGLFRNPQHNNNSGGHSIAMSTPATSTTTAPEYSAAPSLVATGVIPGTVAAPVLLATGNTDKPSYNAGETVDITITLENLSSQPVAITGFPPLSIMDSRTKQPVYTFKTVPQTDTLNYDGTVTYTYTTNTLSAGEYYLELEDLDLQGQTVKMLFNTPVQFTVY